MRNGYSADQVREAERPHLEVGEPLMARAAAALAQITAAALSGASRVLVLAGSGNNGADAMFAAAQLAELGHAVTVVAVGSRLHAEAADAAEAAGATVLRHVDTESVVTLAAASSAVMDGILGTGASSNSALRGRGRDVVVAIRPLLAVPRRPLVIAVDIPSGVDPTTGAVPDPGAVLPADITVTFGAYKAGLLIEPASRLAGDIRLIDIGITADYERMQPIVTVA